MRVALVQCYHRQWPGGIEQQLQASGQNCLIFHFFFLLDFQMFGMHLSVRVHSPQSLLNKK
jgi:hypothetical protein